MSKIYLLNIIVLVICVKTFSQNSSQCNELMYQSSLLYDKKEYKKSLVFFNKAIGNKCKTTTVELYNGACIASLAKNKNLAIKYLRLSAEMGYSDTLHMSKDNDLNFIRNSEGYKNVIKYIEIQFQNLKKELAGITLNNIQRAVPYNVNGKWGWLDRTNLRPVCKPIFEYCDFKNAKGLCFFYNNNNYILTNNLTVEKYVDEGESNALLSRMETAPEINNDTISFKGFEVDYKGKITHSGRFLNVELIKESVGLKPLAIATNPSNNKGIINQDGTTYKFFDFNFSDINYFWGNDKNTYFIAKRLNKKEVIITDRNGVFVYNKPIESYDYVENYQRDPIGRNIFVGFLSLIKITVLGKENFFHTKSLTQVLPKSYEKIILINGPTSDYNRSGSPANNGISEYFFYITDGKTQFYVDEKGVEYKIK